jgi:hypothetical protein
VQFLNIGGNPRNMLASELPTPVCSETGSLVNRSHKHSEVADLLLIPPVIAHPMFVASARKRSG